MIRAIALVSAAGLAASALAQTAPPTLEVVVRTGTTDAVPGVNTAAEPNATWRTASSFPSAFQASQIDNLGNVLFQGTLQGNVNVPHPIAGGTAIASATGVWYGGRWAGTGGTGTLKLIARTGYGMLPTGTARWDATTNPYNHQGNDAPTANGPWAIAQGTSLPSSFSLTGNGNFTLNYGQTALVPTSAQVTAGNNLINGILGSRAVDTTVTPNIFRLTNERMVWTGQVGLSSNGQTVTNQLGLLSQKGDIGPNTEGAVFNSSPDALSNPNLLDSQGRMANFQTFRAGVGDTDGTLFQGITGTQATNGGALYFGSRAGNQQMIYRTGTNNSSPWNTTTANRTAIDYSWLPVANSVISGLGNASNNNNGEVLFTAQMKNDAALGVSDANSAFLAKRTAGGTVSVVAQSGAPAPGLTGVVYPPNSSTFGAPFSLPGGGAFNRNGQFMYGTTLANAASSTAITAGVNDAAVYVASIGSATPRLWHQRGESAPIIGGDPFNPVNLDISANSTFYRLNAQSKVLWTPTLAGSGVNTAAGSPNTSTAMYLSQLAADGSTESDTLLARRGDVINYGGTNFRWGGFFNTLLNNSGQVVFSTTFQNDLGSTTGQPNILFAWDPLTGFQKVVAVGDVVGGITVASFSVSTQYNADGAAAFTDNGWLTFTITGPTVSGIRQMAVIRTQIIPAPGAAALLGLAGIAAARRRRRGDDHSSSALGPRERAREPSSPDSPRPGSATPTEAPSCVVLSPPPPSPCSRSARHRPGSPPFS